MRWQRIALTICLLVVVAFGWLWVAQDRGISTDDLQAALPADFVADTDKGEILYRMGGCANCHTMAASRDIPSGGKGLETAHGIFVPPNITPDPATGIGSWSDTDFVNAMRAGLSPDGRHYYPAFPYTSYATVSISDLLHLKAYLDNLPAVTNRTPSHQLSFPFNLRPALALWKPVAHRARPFEADPEKTDEWNRGAYIVNGLGHCGTCHTPRNLLFAESSSQKFAGARALKEGEKPAPRLAGIDRDEILNGLSEWAGAVSERSSMYLVTLAYSNHVPLTDHDAIATYLSSLPRK
ncbi:MAG: cytochrome c [Rhodobacteraceae bacterium]|nr:cytochrome c [Paracoccaceae bacterium]